jgi:hypothetical protein
MPGVTIHVWHTSDGRITAIGRPLSASRLKVIPLSERDCMVFETNVDEHLITQLHETHVVDVHRRVLVPRDVKRHFPDAGS